MSRSYKKHPVVTNDWAGRKLTKKWANHKFRRTDSSNIPNGKQYRKVYDSWNINDYKPYWTEEEARSWYRTHKDKFSKYKDENEYIRKVWFPSCKRK